MRHFVVFFSVIMIIMVCLAGVFGATPGTISYQGRLTDDSGQPVADGDYQVTFNIYSLSSGGDTLWTSGARTINLANGLFNYLLGSHIPLPEGLFAAGADRWLGITVNGNPEYSPRVKMAAVPYSFQALYSDTADYAFAGAGGDVGGWTDDGTIVRLVTIEDSVAIGAITAAARLYVEGDVRVSDKANIGTGNTNDGYRAFVAGEANTAAGNYSAVVGGAGSRTDGDYSGILNGQYNYTESDYTVVAGGRSDSAYSPYSSVGGGLLNIAIGNFSRISGGNSNRTWSEASAVGGGYYNSATGNYAVIAGGGPSDPGNPTTSNNATYDNYGTIGGGGGNRVGVDNANPDDQTFATVAGGKDNAATSTYAAVGGGSDNTAGGYGSAVPGGYSNSATGNYSIAAGNDNTAGGTGSVVAGGDSNSATVSYSGVGSGQNNAAEGGYSYVCGGTNNRIEGTYSSILGGSLNHITNDHAVICGGKWDTASGEYASIGGGWRNMATEFCANVSGGHINRAKGYCSTINGGYANTITGQYSVIPGGGSNNVTGDYSFAAGQRAKALHSGVFVWADVSPIDFESTDDMQFLIRAQRGVGINTNAPTTDLEVAGTIYSNYGGFKFPDGTVQTTAATTKANGWIKEDNMARLESPTDLVGIGTSAPTEKLEVAGNVKADGDLIVNGAYKGTLGSGGGAPFPRPAYNSGWVDLEPGETRIMGHNLGGDEYDYIVDIQFRDDGTGDSYGIHQSMPGSSAGSGYRNLNNRNIQVYRAEDDSRADECRVRIWVIR